MTQITMKPMWVFMSAMLILSFPGRLLAQETQTVQQLTLPAAINNALTHNPQVTAVREGLAAAEAQVTTARAGLFPRLDLSESARRTTNPMWAFGTKLNQGEIAQSDFAPDKLNDPDPINNFATALNASWQVFDGGNAWHGWQAARSQAAAVAEGVTRTEQQVAARAAQAYVGMLLAEENLRVIEQSLETARAHSKLVASRFEGGFVVKSDLLRAQVRIAELDQARLRAANDVDVAAAHLNAAMGLPLDSTFSLATPFSRCRPLLKGFEAWRREALEKRPDMVAMDLRQVAAEKQIKQALSGHLPHLQVHSAYEINSEDFSDSHDNWTVGAAVSLNLFAGKQISSRVTAAKAARRQLAAQREALAQQIQVETRAAFLHAQSAWQQIQVASSALAAAGEGLRIVGNRYKSGLLTIVSLLDAEVADQEARMRHFKAMHDYKVARIQLALAAGVIDAEFQ
ncbi:MAG: TolC family protein [Desulfosarcinaceae bacterium]